MTKYPDEADIIISATNEFLISSGLSKTYFASEILAPKLGDSHPKYIGDEFIRWKDRKQKDVSRILRWERPFPLEIKWQWIDCLPEKYAEIVTTRLFACVGRTMPLPEFSESEHVDSNVEKIFQAASEVTQNLSPAYDGKYDENDCLDASNRLMDSLIDNVVVSLKEAKRLRAGTKATGYKYNINEFKLCGQTKTENE